ncbi:MAG: UbiA family prenyltransferase, partial [Acidobacteriota bacterium]|nr:UbiA family prenyltransferase [Acidobacteriota bacterium]
QWTKNLFVLVPLLFAGRLSDPAAVGAALLAFASFSAAASAVYLFNDLRDRERDRTHPLKRHRPLASGRLSPAVAAVAALLLAAAAAAVAVRLGAAFGLALGAYLAINLLYMLTLERLALNFGNTTQAAATRTGEEPEERKPPHRDLRKGNARRAIAASARIETAAAIASGRPSTWTVTSRSPGGTTTPRSAMSTGSVGRRSRSAVVAR